MRPQDGSLCLRDERGRAWCGKVDAKFGKPHIQFAMKRGYPWARPLTCVDCGVACAESMVASGFPAVLP